MGEQQKGTSLNTLLPKAEVHFHVQDDTAIAALETLKQDWRYKRVEIIHEKGLLDGAINFYAEYEAPSLLIVETDSIDEGFMDKLDKLAANLDEGTAAIIIGPVNDVYVYRQLIAMGVSDYLVRPIDPQVLSEVVAKTLVDKIGVSNSRLIAVTGTKGGAGVSTLAQAAALTLSGKE
ncbi:MAG: type II secretion protein ATPase, partial [Pseudomonadota bacterium]|nr:type II secretion protein ATPase [Pseudomonadota bacterium]